MSGVLGFPRLKKSGTDKSDSPIGYNDSTVGRIVALVQFVMGLRTPQACLLLWIAIPEDYRSRGIRLPITSLFWILGRALLPTSCCLEKRNERMHYPESVSAIKQEPLTVACNFTWSERDWTEVLSGSGLPDTVKTWHMGEPSAPIA